MELSSLYDKFEHHYEINGLHKFAKIQIKVYQNSRWKDVEERNA